MLLRRSLLHHLLLLMLEGLLLHVLVLMLLSLSLSLIRSVHNGGAIRRGSAAGQCSRPHRQLLALVSPWPVTDACGFRCSTAHMSEAHDANAPCRTQSNDRGTRV